MDDGHDTPAERSRWAEPTLAPSELAGDVVCSWRATVVGTHQLVPDGCVDVLWLGTGQVFVCGTETAAWEFTLPPGLVAVGVRFRPGVAPRLFRTDAIHMTNQRVRLADLLGGAAERELAERAAEATDPLSVLEDEVRHWCVQAPTADPIAQGITDGALATQPMPVAQLAERVGLSPRQLHRRSERMFGYGASTLARIVRFQRFAVRAQHSHGRTLAELAALSGYHDQSHLARDAREIAGSSPSAFLAAHDPTFPTTSDPYKTPARAAG